MPDNESRPKTAKEQIFAIALNCFNIDYDRIKNNSDSIEIKYCENFLDSAVSFCSTVKPWSFLIEEETFTEVDLVGGESFRGLHYGYNLPDDFGYPLYINGKHDSTYAIRQDMIFFPYNTVNVLDYIPNTIYLDTTSFQPPVMYKYFIAYRLAYEISQFIAPNGGSEQRIMEKYQLAYKSLEKIENDSFREKNPSTDWFVV